MVKIKFKEGPQFVKLPLVKYVYNACDVASIREASEMVKSGVIKCLDSDCDNTIKEIVKCGGIQIEVVKMKPLPDDTASVQSKKENVAAIRIVPYSEKEIAIRSEIPIQKHVFQTLKNYPSLWQFVTNEIPFICGLIQLQNGEDEYCSQLAVRVPVNRNTLVEINSLSKAVRDVHAEMISTILKFHNLTERFKPFIDDVEVEAGSDSNN